MPYESEKESSASRWTWAVVFGTLGSGTVASLAAKTLFQVKTVGHCDDQATYFQKPYFLTLAMFIGEAMCLAYYYLFVNPKTAVTSAHRQRRQEAQVSGQIDGVNQQALLDGDNSAVINGHGNNGGDVSDNDSDSGLPPVPVWFFLILCTFDLTASTLNFVGLVWVSASLNQMFRGSMAVFVALFSVCFLRRRLAALQWVAIIIVVAGLTTVGFSSYLQPKDPEADSGTEVSTGKVFLGIALIVASSALNSFQNVIEELLMKMLSDYAEPHPLEIVGWEGIFGTLLAGLVMLPVVHHLPGDDCGGRQEDAIDTLIKFKNPVVVVLVLAYVLGLALMNYFSMELSRLLSAVVRNLVSAMRTVMVWMVSVLLYYAVGKSYGEELGMWSLVEAAGFILLIGGSILYSRHKETTLPRNEETNEAGASEAGEHVGEEATIEHEDPNYHYSHHHPHHGVKSPAGTGVHNSVPVTYS